MGAGSVVGSDPAAIAGWAGAPSSRLETIKTSAGVIHFMAVGSGNGFGRRGHIHLPSRSRPGPLDMLVAFFLGFERRIFRDELGCGTTEGPQGVIKAFRQHSTTARSMRFVLQASSTR